MVPSRCCDKYRFVVPPKQRWIVERATGWISRSHLRPHGHDPHHAETAGQKALSVNQNFPDGHQQAAESQPFRSARA
jgi:hypothetical protein